MKSSTTTYKDFNFNPFGGLEDREILRVIVPKFNTNAIIDLIHSKDQIIIELLGKKGRGKTLHLRYLNLVLKDYPIFFLNEHSKVDTLLDNDAELMLVDSIHHLNLRARNKLFKLKKKLILTTHISRRWEYKFVKKPYEIIRFKGIEYDFIKTIIDNRIRVASNTNDADFKIKKEKIDTLIKTYKDDFRAILNHLYDDFQSKHYE